MIMLLLALCVAVVRAWCLVGVLVPPDSTESVGDILCFCPIDVLCPCVGAEAVSKLLLTFRSMRKQARNARIHPPTHASAIILVRGTLVLFNFF